MIRKTLTVVNKSGIHARPAALIVEVATQFKSDTFFLKEGIRANAKSIMNIMLLAAEYGSEVEVEVTGPDEKEAMEAIEELFTKSFLHE